MHRLTDKQIEVFKQDGFIFPLKAMGTKEAYGIRQRLEATEAEQGSLTGKFRSPKNHLLMTWLDSLVRWPDILDPIEQLLGPNILCWGTAILIKEPNDGTYVSWHQDLNYWGLTPANVVSAWLALTPATKTSGCMRMIKGSHKWTNLVHRDVNDNKNLLSRGQSIQKGIEEKSATVLELQPGEFSLHHGNTAHASAPNQAEERRIGIAIRYIATNVRPTKGNDSAILVRGNDQYGNFHLETAPLQDFDMNAIAEHEKIVKMRQTLLLDKSAIKKASQC
ncbi:MAG: phytanoyl-CoA dioxygenase [Magnetovibrio sp.]|nr:phytanoyl-CoA dioxygenase [Magnetovibrio sp.]